MSYKDFIRQLDDHITPTDAEREYQDYLAHHWGSELRREFEAKKDERWCDTSAPYPFTFASLGLTLLVHGTSKHHHTPSLAESETGCCRRMRAKYDPREIKKLQEEHSSKVADLAKEFVADLQDGKIDPDSEDFNQVSSCSFVVTGLLSFRHSP